MCAVSERGRLVGWGLLGLGLQRQLSFNFQPSGFAKLLRPTSTALCVSPFPNLPFPTLLPPLAQRRPSSG